MIRIISKRLFNTASCRFVFSSADTTTTTPPPEPSKSTISSTTTPQQRNLADFRQYNANDGFYWRSPFGTITVPDMTVDEYVWKNLAKWPNKIAIVCGITGRKYTYARLRDHCAAAAYRLRTEYGLQRGDVIAISMTNQPEYAIAVLGAIEAGLVVTTINPAYTTQEHVKQLMMSQAKLIIGLADGAESILLPSVAELALKLQRTETIPIVVLRTSRMELLPSGVRDFAELMNLKGILSNPLDLRKFH